MKTSKKLLVLLLAVIMMFTMGLGAYAASITINGVKGQTYTAYKIFDVTKSESGSYAYTADQNIYDLLYTDGVSQVPGVTLTATTTEGVYSAAVATEEAAKALAVFLNEHKSDLTAAASSVTAGEDGKAVIDNLDPGYYFVDSSLGALCILHTAADTMNVTEKNPEPDIDKKVSETKEEDSFDIGDSVPFKLTVTTGEKADTSYIIHDVMSAGLTLDPSSFKITVIMPADGDTEAVETEVDASNYEIRTSGLTDGCTFEIEFNEAFTNTLPQGTQIIVRYNATLNENAKTGEIDPETNKVKLQYGGTYTPEHIVRVYTAKITVDKRADKKDGVPLNGATFVLKNSNGEFYKANLKDGKVSDVEWVKDQKDATSYTTDETGIVEFVGLKAGKYELIETAAPVGYNLLTTPINVTISDKGEGDVAAYANHTETVINQSGKELPSTGGIGTTLFVVIGSIAVLGAGLFLVVNKRMSKENI